MTVSFKGWKINTDSYEVSDPNGNIVPFTIGEFRLLNLLASSKGKVLTREYILDKIRNRNYNIFDRSIDIMITRIRKKLGDDYHVPKFIKTVRGIGYIFLAMNS